MIYWEDLGVPNYGFASVSFGNCVRFSFYWQMEMRCNSSNSISTHLTLPPQTVPPHPIFPEPLLTPCPSSLLSVRPSSPWAPQARTARVGSSGPCYITSQALLGTVMATTLVINLENANKPMNRGGKKKRKEGRLLLLRSGLIEKAQNSEVEIMFYVWLLCSFTLFLIVNKTKFSMHTISPSISSFFFRINMQITFINTT